MLLAGIGQVDQRQKRNFLVVDSSKPSYPDASLMCTSPLLSETNVSVIESAFEEYTQRKDIAIVLINQHVRIICSPSYSLISEHQPLLRLRRELGRWWISTNKRFPRCWRSPPKTTHTVCCASLVNDMCIPTHAEPQIPTKTQY